MDFDCYFATSASEALSFRYEAKRSEKSFFNHKGHNAGTKNAKQCRVISTEGRNLYIIRKDSSSLLTSFVRNDSALLILLMVSTSCHFDRREKSFDFYSYVSYQKIPSRTCFVCVFFTSFQNQHKTTAGQALTRASFVRNDTHPVISIRSGSGVRNLLFFIPVISTEGRNLTLYTFNFITL